jgi:hypothetical protein
MSTSQEMRAEVAGIRANAAKDKDKGRAASWLSFAVKLEAWAVAVAREERSVPREARLVQYRARAIGVAATMVADVSMNDRIRNIGKIADEIAQATLAAETPPPAPVDRVETPAAAPDGARS